MEAVQQMNVRIPSELKKQGDKEFAAMGLTPSQVVRKVYEAITGSVDQRKNLKEALQPAEEKNERRKEAERKIAEGEKLQRMIADFRAAHGFAPAPEFSSNAEMQEYIAEAMMERWRERGIA